MFHFWFNTLLKNTSQKDITKIVKQFSEMSWFIKYHTNLQITHPNTD